MREIAAEVFPWERRIAVLEDGKLAEVFRTENETDVGMILRGKIQKVLPGMLCAFVDIGQEKNAVLYFSDVVKKDGCPELSLKKGQDVLVQIIKQAFAEKGARITEEITLPGRLLVLMPCRNELRVSRKISGNEVRGRLKKLMRSLLPEGIGAILRTACEHAPEEEIARETGELLTLWEEIAAQADAGKVPAVVYREADDTERVLREYLDGETTRIYVNDETLYRKITAYVQKIQPESRPKILWQEGELFVRMGLEKELQRAAGRKVWLKSGGFIIFDQTEAMMVVDVNSGKFTGGGDFETNVSLVNLEAAREIPRQLRLRGVGGMILIDFIDMQLEESRDSVIAAMQEELQKDKAHTRIMGFTQLGLLEMTRRKTGRAALEKFTAECGICGGSGRILSLSACANRLKNDLTAAGYLEGKTILVTLHPELAEALRQDAEALAYLTRLLGKPIQLLEDRQRRWADYQIASE